MVRFQETTGTPWEMVYVKTNFKFDQPTRKQLKAARARLQAAIERAENAKVRERSDGRCEIWFRDGEGWEWGCCRAALHVHHKMSGIGVRGRGPSALAENKLHVCPQCHSDIHAKRIVEQPDHTWRPRQ